MSGARGALVAHFTRPELVELDLLVKRADRTIEQVVDAETVRGPGGPVFLVPLIKSQSTRHSSTAPLRQN